MKNIILITILIFGCIYHTSGQIKSNGNISETISDQSAFFDLSGSNFNNTTNKGKGLVFPQTDLTVFEFVQDGNIANFSTGYDGMIVYNTATGNTVPNDGTNFTGVGSQPVEPGFYYFSNPTSASVNGNGEWKPLEGSGDPRYIISATEAKTNADIGNTNNAEYVKEVTVVVSGLTRTQLDLSNDFTTEEIDRFRKALIYDSSGNFVMEASAGYNTSTNELVTGNGMMNKLLPDDTYTIEIYYTKQ